MKKYYVFWIPCKHHADTHDVIRNPIERNISDEPNDELIATCYLLDNKNIIVKSNIFKIELCYESHCENGLYLYSYETNNNDDNYFVQESIPKAIYHMIKEFYHTRKNHVNNTDRALVSDKYIDIKSKNNEALCHYLRLYEQKFTIYLEHISDLWEESSKIIDTDQYYNIILKKYENIIVLCHKALSEFLCCDALLNSEYIDSSIMGQNLEKLIFNIKNTVTDIKLIRHDILTKFYGDQIINDYSLNVLDVGIKNNEKYMTVLFNFLRHSMKNTILCMDGILSTISGNTIDNEEINSLKTSLKILWQTINNFNDLTPHSQNEEFTLKTLLSNVEALTKGTLKNVEYDFQYDRGSSITINQSYLALLQILHNLIINATKAMETVTNKKMLVKADIDNKECKIKIADTGIEIPKENLGRIFFDGFSTTGGTGTGLFYAKYVCDLFKGSILVNTQCEKPFTKEFTINFPIK